jgi:electron transfer flavoprotein beta subunit
VDRGLLVSDDGAESRDAMGTARVLARVIEPLAPDLVLCGSRTSDTGQGIVPGGLAEFLRLPQVTGVSALRLAEGGDAVIALRRLERGRRQEVTCPLPAVIAVEEGVAPVGYPSLPRYVDALTRPIERVDAAAVQPSRGLDGASVELVALGPLRPRPKKMLAPDSALPAAERLSQLMAGGARKTQATDVVEGPAEALAAALVRFLRQQGFA